MTENRRHRTAKASRLRYNFGEPPAVAEASVFVEAAPDTCLRHRLRLARVGATRRRAKEARGQRAEDSRSQRSEVGDQRSEEQCTQRGKENFSADFTD